MRIYSYLKVFITVGVIFVMFNLYQTTLENNDSIIMSGKQISRNDVEIFLVFYPIWVHLIEVDRYAINVQS